MGGGARRRRRCGLSAARDDLRHRHPPGRHPGRPVTGAGDPGPGLAPAAGDRRDHRGERGPDDRGRGGWRRGRERHPERSGRGGGSAPDCPGSTGWLAAPCGGGERPEDRLMRLTVNGKPREASDSITLLGYLESLGINPQIVAVELNGEIVKRPRYGEVVLHDGDVLEIVRMVGGGED